MSREFVRRANSALQFVGLRHTDESKARWREMSPHQKAVRIIALIAAGFFGVTLINLKSKYGF